ncbi:MAG: ATP-binding cassette domain-containing protein [Bacilli bacterium]|nr:ATP-binding cassette domain-containing protein [Bacilli bacterium]
MNVLEVKDMDLFIELNGLTTSIIGPSNSGKTVLAKRLCNKLDNSSILIDNKGIKEYDVKTLRRSIAVVLDDNNYINEYVVEELAYYQDRLDFDLEESQKNIDEIATFFKIKGLLNKKVQLIHTSDRILIKILSLLIINPSVFVVDNLLSYLKSDKRSLLFKYVKEKGISFINLTTNAEELLESDNVIVVNNFKSVISGSPKSILEGNSILPYMGLKLPFVVDLSHNLILYNVVNKIYMDSKALVNKLWK